MHQTDAPPRGSHKHARQNTAANTSVDWRLHKQNNNKFPTHSYMCVTYPASRSLLLRNVICSAGPQSDPPHSLFWCTWMGRRPVKSDARAGEHIIAV